MAYTYGQFSADCRATLLADPGVEGRKKVISLLERLLGNEDFIAEHFPADAEAGRPIVFQDPDTDFCVQLHIHGDTGGGMPHDHGPSWAIYGQALGYTDMTAFRRLDDGGTEGHAEIEISQEFRMNPGDVGLFNESEIHSIRFDDTCRVVGITDGNLDKVDHNLYDVDMNEIRSGSPVR